MSQEKRVASAVGWSKSAASGHRSGRGGLLPTADRRPRPTAVRLFPRVEPPMRWTRYFINTLSGKSPRRRRHRADVEDARGRSERLRDLYYRARASRDHKLEDSSARKEMTRDGSTGCHERAIQRPSCGWTGRWQKYGKELCESRTGTERDVVRAPDEEVITDTVATHISS